ncbi:MAG: hypothetical protein EOM52_02470 [Clostridia bacterium]|nr:hypothetical protein [Clostridia bacterium]
MMMKTRLLSLALVLALAPALLPTAALAAGDPKVGAPPAVSLFADSEEQSYTGMPAGGTQAIRLKMTHDSKLMEMQAVREGAGYDYRFNIHFQYRMDGGAWADAYWFGNADNFNETIDSPTCEVVVASAYGSAENVREQETHPTFQNMLLTFQQDGETWHYFDIQNHLVEARVRYELIDNTDDTPAAPQYVSPWSAAAQIGKGAAAVKAPDPFKTAPVLSDMKAKYDDEHGQFPYVTFHAAHPEDVKQAASNPLGMTMYDLEVRYDGGPWQTAVFDTVSSLLASGDDWYPIPNRTDGKAIVVDATKIELRMRYEWYLAADWLPAHEAVVSKVTNASPWSNIIGINADAWSSASAWATPELEKADKAGLIPDVLKGQDLTKPITRAEFAALSVRLYEVMSGKTAAPAPQNPFTDASDPEILKAYALGITKGTTGTTFQPNLLIPREQVATMLTRTVQAAKPALKLDTSGVALFADDALISGFARESVYFMAKNGVIKGFSGNKFGPKNTTAAEEAAGYANATREQSLIIAVRSLETLK